MALQRRLLSALAAATATALVVHQPLSSKGSRRAPTRHNAFDVAFVESVGETVSLPLLFVGSGTYFLTQRGEDFREEESSPASSDEVDIYRDTALRYAGYANEVGEAFRLLVPAWVVPGSYAVAITYVLADTVDKTVKAFASSKYVSSALTACAVLEGVDAFVWQITASVALPGYTIHQVVELVVQALAAADLVDDSNPALAALPTAAGLLTIPFIVKPLDELAEKLMDFTLRKIWTPYLESCSIE
mmetsp:Transcript_21463/g.66206  ORF Transcript_21463/g.66206 Transcript_21463/m.66206 type:complete len:246 (-) Transcript_21463:14-751(-)